MKRRSMTIPAILTGVAIALCTPAPPAGAGDEAGPPSVSGEVRALAEELRGLRAVKGHFEGGPPNRDVDANGGRKHVVMQKLAEALGGGAFLEEQVVSLLGVPDAVARPGDARWAETFPDRAAAPAETEKILIYLWRGWHDYLYFEVAGGRVTRAAWWFAGE